MSSVKETIVVMPLPAMRKSFRTTSVEGGKNPRYTMVFEFETMEELDKADDEWHAFRAAGICLEAT